MTSDAASHVIPFAQRELHRLAVRHVPDDLEGWIEVKDVAWIKSDGQAMVGEITGGNPYVMRRGLSIQGSES